MEGLGRVSSQGRGGDFSEEVGGTFCVSYTGFVFLIIMAWGVLFSMLMFCNKCIMSLGVTVK